MSYVAEVMFRPTAVTLDSTSPLSLTSVKSVARAMPAAGSVPIMGDDNEMPVGVASEGKATELTVTIEFEDLAQAQALIAKADEVADLEVEYRNVEGVVANIETIPNCTAWGEASEFEHGETPGVFTVVGNFFYGEGDEIDITPKPA